MKSLSKIALSGLMAGLLTVSAGSSAFASKDLCNAGPESGWKPKEDVRTMLTAEGYEVRKIKIEDGCYEAYAKKDDKKLEVYVHPVTLKIVEIK